MADPVLLTVRLSSKSYLYCRLLYPDRHTLPTLVRRYPEMYAAIGLIQQGDLHCLERGNVISRHQHWGDDWLDVQPRLSSSIIHLKSVARSLKITTLYVNQNAQWVVDKNGE